MAILNSILDLFSYILTSFVDVDLFVILFWSFVLIFLTIGLFRLVKL